VKRITMFFNENDAFARHAAQGVVTLVGGVILLIVTIVVTQTTDLLTPGR